MPTLQMVSGGGNVPTVNMNGQIVPAPPLYNNGQPATAAWAIDPINRSASPLVGAYSAYPHVVYAPQRIGADNLLLALSTAVANAPFTQRALELASRGVVPGVSRTPGASPTPGTSTPYGRKKNTFIEKAATQPKRAADDLSQVGPPRPAPEQLLPNPYPDGMLLTAPPEPTILDNAQNGLVPREEVDMLNRTPTEAEVATALGALGMTEGAGITALSQALARDTAIKKYGEWAGGKMALSKFLTTPAGRAMLGSALGRVIALGAVPLNLALAAKGFIDYGTANGMNVLDWNSSDDMTIPDGVLE